MKYTFAIIGLFGLLLFTACAPFGSDPTPVASTSDLQTRAAALSTINAVQGTLNAPYPTDPPATQTWYAEHGAALDKTATAQEAEYRDILATSTTLAITPTP